MSWRDTHSSSALTALKVPVEDGVTAGGSFKLASELAGPGYTASSPLTIAGTVVSLAQSGATLGQALSWNGTAWVPTTVFGASYALPAATTSALGGVKADGVTVAVAGDGTLSAPGQGALAFASKTVLTGNELTLVFDPSTGAASRVAATLLKGQKGDTGPVGPAGAAGAKGDPGVGSTETLTTIAASGASQALAFPAAGGTAFFDITLTANCALTLSGAASGVRQSVAALLRQDSTGGRTVTWPANVVWANGMVPTMPSAADSLLRVEFEKFSGTTVIGRW